MICWPGYLRRHAYRQISALDAWSENQGWRHRRRAMDAFNAALGYYEARDWMGVSAQYHKISELIKEGT